MNVDLILTISAALLMTLALWIMLARWLAQCDRDAKLARWIREQPPAIKREWLVCPECNGREEIPTGEIERGTGYAMTIECPVCQGSGEIPFETEEDDLERARR